MIKVPTPQDARARSALRAESRPSANWLGAALVAVQHRRRLLRRAWAPVLRFDVSEAHIPRAELSAALTAASDRPRTRLDGRCRGRLSCGPDRLGARRASTGGAARPLRAVLDPEHDPDRDPQTDREHAEEEVQQVVDPWLLKERLTPTGGAVRRGLSHRHDAGTQVTRSERELLDRLDLDPHPATWAGRSAQSPHAPRRSRGRSRPPVASPRKVVKRVELRGRVLGRATPPGLGGDPPGHLVALRPYGVAGWATSCPLEPFTHGSPAPPLAPAAPPPPAPRSEPQAGRSLASECKPRPVFRFFSREGGAMYVGAGFVIAKPPWLPGKAGGRIVGPTDSRGRPLPSAFGRERAPDASTESRGSRMFRRLRLRRPATRMWSPTWRCSSRSAAPCLRGQHRVQHRHRGRPGQVGGHRRRRNRLADVKDNSINTFDVHSFLGVDVIDNSLTGADVDESTLNLATGPWHEVGTPGEPPFIETSSCVWSNFDGLKRALSCGTASGSCT